MTELAGRPALVTPRPPPRIGSRFTSRTTANVTSSSASPSTAIAPRSPLSLRS